MFLEVPGNSTILPRSVLIGNTLGAVFETDIFGVPKCAAEFYPPPFLDIMHIQKIRRRRWSSFFEDKEKSAIYDMLQKDYYFSENHFKNNHNIFKHLLKINIFEMKIWIEYYLTKMYNITWPENRFIVHKIGDSFADGKKEQGFLYSFGIHDGKSAGNIFGYFFKKSVDPVFLRLKNEPRC